MSNSATISNPVATITNSTANDLDIYDAYSQQGSKGVITYTQLGTVTAGQTSKIQTIHFASQLQAMRTGQISALNNNYYYQFPVAVMPILAIGSKQETTYTIDDNDQKVFEQSFKFQKYVTANGNSKIAAAFNTALGEKKQKEAVDAFFAATESFKTCTMESWAAIVSWQSQFTSAWQGPYYLYTVSATKSDTPKLAATVSITSNTTTNTAVLTMADSSQATSLQMNGSGMEEQNVGEGPLSVSLTPVWLNVVQTQGTTAQYLIGSALSGTVNGEKVYGNGISRKLPASATKGMSAKEKLAAQQAREQAFDRKFSQYTEIANILVALTGVYFMYKQLKNEHTSESDDAADEAAAQPEATEETVNQAIQEQDQDYEGEIAALPADHPEIGQAETNAGELGSRYEGVATAERETELQNMVDEQMESLTETLETQPPTNALEDAAENLQNAQDDLENGNLDEATSTLTTVKENIQNADQDNWAEYEKTELDNTQEAVENGLQQNESIQEAQQENATEADQEPDNFDPPENSFDEPETDPIDID